MPKFMPEGWHTVTPRIITKDVPGLVQFLKVVFDASGEIHAGRPTEMQIGDSILMVSDGDGGRETMPAFLYVYVDDTDGTYQRAVGAGALSIENPTNMPYGDRRAMVQDSWGNFWQIATRKM